MKRMIKKSSLRNSDKEKLTNHSARKTLVKTLGQNYISKFEIICTTCHNFEVGLDAMIVGTRNNSVPYLMILILLIKILCIFNEPIQTMGHFTK